MLVYADDIILITENKEQMQANLEIIEQYGREMKVNFSTNKCQTIIINGQQEENLTLNGQQLQRVNKYKYLGLEITNEGIDNIAEKRIIKGEKWWGRISNISKFRSNKYEITRGLWKGVAIPSLLYGIEIIPIKIRDIEKMEQTQNKIVRGGL